MGTGSFDSAVYGTPAVSATGTEGADGIDATSDSGSAVSGKAVGSEPAILGVCTGYGSGVSGVSGDGYGVFASSDNGVALFAESPHGGAALFEGNNGRLQPCNGRLQPRNNGRLQLRNGRLQL
jgi:hypothetical protein